MLEKDVVLSKINTIQNCLKSIRTVISDDLNKIDNDFITEDVVVINLQRAAQASIDIAKIIIKFKSLSLPSSYRDSFKILYKNKIIGKKISEKMANMASFRNIAVHDYQEISKDILKAVIQNHLDDFKNFYDQAIQVFLTTP